MERAIMANISQHVALAATGKNRWSVRSTGSVRASAIFNTQEEAIECGRKIARKQRVDLFIHGKDGRITEHKSYSGTDASTVKSAG